MEMFWILELGDKILIGDEFCTLGGSGYYSETWVTVTELDLKRVGREEVRPQDPPIRRRLNIKQEEKRRKN